jgi:hypothetical protein
MMTHAGMHASNNRMLSTVAHVLPQARLGTPTFWCDLQRGSATEAARCINGRGGRNRMRLKHRGLTAASGSVGQAVLFWPAAALNTGNVVH